MNAEKHITPILLIVVVFVALFSTYAWFSASTYIKADLSLFSGTPTSFSINEGQGAQGDDTFNFPEKYSGQKGYKEDGTVYTDADAPFSVFNRHIIKSARHGRNNKAENGADIVLDGGHAVGKTGIVTAEITRECAYAVLPHGVAENTARVAELFFD